MFGGGGGGGGAPAGGPSVFPPPHPPSINNDQFLREPMQDLLVRLSSSHLYKQVTINETTK